MRIGIIAVGRAKRGPEVDLFEFYRSRVAWPCALTEVEEKRKLPTDQRIAREAELIREKIPDGAVTIALDERGDDMTSRKLAAKLRDWEDGGVSDLVFLIGGADGLASELRDGAGARLRFGRLTWPHMLVRPMLAEQIYRCRQILDGHPYHRD